MKAPSKAPRSQPRVAQPVPDARSRGRARAATRALGVLMLLAVSACGGSAQTGPGDDGGAGSAGAKPSPGGSAGTGNSSSAGAGSSSNAGSGNTGSAGTGGKEADCVVGNMSYPSGTSWKCDCNTCFCMDGHVGSTLAACLSCTYAGQTYNGGESFPSSDGCNTCTCEGGGSVRCTEKACACNPAKEWNRKYVSSTPEQCALIDFACTGNTKGFGNDCGCGCEQDSSCPEAINCIPGAPDCSALKEKCPLSIVLQ